MDVILSFTPLIPLLPLLAFAAIILFTNRHNRLSSSIAIGGIGLSTLLAWAVVLATILGGEHAQAEGWQLSVPWLPAGTTVLDLGFAVDGFTAAMLFMVPFVCLMIFIYSQGYMNLGQPNQDPRYARFFAYMSLFAAGMLGLVVARDMVLLFVSWEVMGLCSYLLIGFWSFRKHGEPHIDEAQVSRARQAALKAFITTRIGDVLLFSGIALLYSYTGTLAFREVFQPQTLEMLKGVTLVGTPAVTVIALLVFGGAVGKSAQFPLHVWLPDAMEGPTPVSALIHAATMVAAGVYLVARTLPLFIAGFDTASAPALQWVAVIGAITALMGATIGLAQDDIKRVLAYSTISQLGYMMMGLGLGSLVAGIFHLVTHAFFKALLFLGAGSVIHGVEGGHHAAAHEAGHAAHGPFSPNDMKVMGGLRYRMPATFYTYLVGTLALVGIVPFAGFWSKDEILAEAFHLWRLDGTLNLPFWLWLAGTAGAFLTALYMGRQLGLVFWGEPRHIATRRAHESPTSMTAPLVVLAVFALLLGFVNAPFLGNPLHHFMGNVHEVSEVVHSEAVPFSFVVAGISTLVAVLGLIVGWWLHKGYRAGQVEPFQAALGPVFVVLKNKYYVDEIYQLLIIRPIVWLAGFCFRIDDRWIIDPFVDLVGAAGRLASDVSRVVDSVVVDRWFVEGTAQLFNGAGRWLRYSETGRVQNYLLVLAVTVLMLLGLYLYF